MTTNYNQTFTTWYSRTVEIKELHVVYAFWSSANEPLYVGCTRLTRFTARMQQHFATARVKQHVRKCTILYDTFNEKEALHQEHSAIVRLKPQWNIHKTTFAPALSLKNKKRPNGEGTKPTKREDGRWWARYTITLPTGERKRKAVYAPTYNECEAKLRQALTARDANED